MSKKKAEQITHKINKLARNSILELVPYASARSEFSGKAQAFLDANENPYGSALEIHGLVKNLNRYPDPLQQELRAYASKLFGVASENIFVGNGSDEAIDLLLRVFCEPGQDKILITPPTYAMYEVIANIQGIKILNSNLSNDFQIVYKDLKQKLLKNPKVTFFCSPNNPTANSLEFNLIKKIAANSQGLVVVDEAYIDFSSQTSAIKLINKYHNIVVLRTLSKAWGAAGIRVGFAIAHPQIISLLQKIKAPYNLSTLAQKSALKILKNKKFLSSSIRNIKSERERLHSLLPQCRLVDKVFHSDSSFYLVRFKNFKTTFERLNSLGIIVRDRSKTKGCKDCARVSIGTKKENDKLLKALGLKSKSGVKK